MNRKRQWKQGAYGIAAALMLGAPNARAAVDLVTLPTRESTQLTIYNSEDITMVREHRLLTVKKGINRIQFSWANTLIDPTSIDFRLLNHVDKVDLLDTTFPSGRTDALQWNIHSDMDGRIPVEIRYFTSGITWSADYVGMANATEEEMKVKGYVRVLNRSGELYDNAEVRLVVGNINLVEKIADLATRPVPTPGPPALVERPAEEAAEMKEAFDNALNAALPSVNSASGEIRAPKVVKKGLSEYFLFTIAGRQNIRDGEPTRLVALNADGVPLKSIYKLSDRQGGSTFTKFYRFENKKLNDDDGKPRKIPDMENLGLSPFQMVMCACFPSTTTRTWLMSAGPQRNTFRSGTASKCLSAEIPTSLWFAD